MLNVIPRIIQQQLDRQPEILSGSFFGSALFVDIAGFTGITEELMSRGHLGAEELSDLINKVYRPLIDRVYTGGGSIAVFAGDSITAVFPEKTSNETLTVAENISRYFHSNSPGGIRIRTGLSSGEIKWSVHGDDERAYLFHGPAVLDSAMAVKGTEPGTLTLGPENPRGSAAAPMPSLPARIKPSIARRFVPRQVLSARHSGEFRRVASVFVRFSEDHIAPKVEKTLDLAKDTGGWVNGIFHDDKGTHALVIFGAPVSRENDYRRAALFASGLMAQLGSGAAAGVAGGTVYAGVVGTSKRCTYTILGDRVNQAARLMQKASWGQVLMSAEMTDRIDSGGTGNLMVGREAELHQLSKWCSPILEGSCAGVFTVSGAAGMGKSLLLENLSGELPDNVRILVMQTDQILQKSLNPFEYLVSDFFGTAGEDTSTAVENFDTRWDRLTSELGTIKEADSNRQVLAELIRGRPFLRVMAGLGTESALYSSLDPRGRFTNTVFALKSFVRGLCLLSPVVLVLEDLHWLDSDSREVFLNLTRNMAAFPLAVLATVRPDEKGEIPELKTWFGTRIGSLYLQPLPENSETALIGTLLPGTPSDELIAFIQTRTEGNPFFAEQFCMYLIENGLLDTENGVTSLAEGSVNIPDGVNAVIVARIDRLSTKLRQMVKTASVLGREFDVQILSQVLSGRSKPLRSVLTEGESEAIWNAVTEVRYIFRHAILRDTVYSMQMRRELRKLHKLTALAIAEVYGDDGSRYAERAYHYREAGMNRDAAVYLRKAGEYGAGQYRNQEALNLYRRLLTLCTTQDEKMDTELRIADLLVQTGERDTAREIIQSKLEEAEKTGSRWFIAQCCRELAKLDHRQGSNDKALGYINRATEIFRELGDTVKMASSLNILGNINTVLGNYDEALNNFAGSNKAAEKADDRITIALNVSNVGNIHLYRYELDRAEEYYLKGIDLCLEVGDRKALANAYNNLAVVWYYRKDFDRCREYLDEFVRISTEIGNMEGLAYIYGNLGILHRELGELDKTIEYHRKQAALAEELGDLYNKAKALQQKAQIHSMQGDFHRAEENLLTAVELCDRTGDQRTCSQTCRDLGCLYTDMNRLEDAMTYLNRACTLGETGSDLEACGSSCTYMGWIALKKGEHEAAAEHAEKALEYKREMGEPDILIRTLMTSSEILTGSGYSSRGRELADEAGSLIEAGEAEEHRDRQVFTRLLALSSERPAEAAEGLRSLLGRDMEDEVLRAEVSHLLFTVEGRQEHRELALSLFRKLYADVPKAWYADRIDLLS